MIAQKINSNGIIDLNKWLQSSKRRNHRINWKHNNQQQWWWKEAIVLGEIMIIYGDNMIAQQITYNVSSGPNKYSHLSMKRNDRKLQNTTINNGESETTPLCRRKKSMIYRNNLISQKNNYQWNKWTQQVVAVIKEE